MTPRYDIEWAIVAAKEPKTKFLFFWGHRGDITRPSPAVFSQWFPAGFDHEGLQYPTAEHWMMAAKARLFGDDEIAAQIIAAHNPGKAKALGRQVRNFDAATWGASAYGIVVQGCLMQFRSHPSLHHYILETGNKILVEASPSDHIWGIGLAKDDPVARDPSQWAGTNLLGFALMEARDILRAEAGQ